MSFSVRVMQSIRVLELKIEHEDLRNYSSWKIQEGKRKNKYKRALYQVRDPNLRSRRKEIIEKGTCLRQKTTKTEKQEQLLKKQTNNCFTEKVKMTTQARAYTLLFGPLSSRAYIHFKKSIYKPFFWTTINI